MARSAGWILAGAVLVLGLVAWAWARVRGQHKEAAVIASDMVETWHMEGVAKDQAKIKDLQGQVGDNSAKIDALEKSIAARKAKINVSYQAAGLTADEINQRFRALKL